MTRIDAVDCHATIAIIGAGPAGLSTAWFLSKNGFHNVTVLEHEL
ncbi:MULTISPECIES: FAD-dependent oxidoreductase [unclassified Bradyrhizobium]|nr:MULTISPECIES: FAD-dependent oxidoreductase [unclassified Bradyrhizobium]